MWEQYDALTGEGKRRYIPPSMIYTRGELLLMVWACASAIRSLDGRRSSRSVSPFLSFYATSFWLTCGAYSHLGEVLSDVAVVVFRTGILRDKNERTASSLMTLTYVPPHG